MSTGTASLPVWGECRKHGRTLHGSLSGACSVCTRDGDDIAEILQADAEARQAGEEIDELLLEHGIDPDFRSWSER